MASSFAFHRLRVALAAAVLAFASGAAQDDPLAQRGLALYGELGCGGCHALAAANSAGWFGPPHDGVADVAAARVADPAYHGAAHDAAGYLRESLTDPAAYLVAEYAVTYHRMPSYAHLSDADLDALVAFLSAQREEADTAGSDRTE